VPIRNSSFSITTTICPGAIIGFVQQSVGEHARRTSCQVRASPEGNGRVPLVRNSVRGPKTTGDPDFLPRRATNVRVCGFH
jgi:hypothetical protein